MGTKKVNVDDRKWNDRFRQKVLDDFERKQDERERRLAEAESQRILKLKIQGLIRDEEEEEEERRKAERAEREERKSASERRFERRKEKQHKSIFRPVDIESQMEILNRDENATRRRNRQIKENGEDGADDYDNNENNDNDENDGALQSQRSESAGHSNDDGVLTYRGHLGRTKTDKTIVHPDLEKLYEEEDLQNLYREAETLVRLTGAMNRQGKK